MKTADKVQFISDEFHAITEEADQLLIRLAQLTALATEARRETGMTGPKSRRTLKHLTNAQPHLEEAIECLALGHAAAEKDAPKADFPWNCPDETRATHLRVIGE